MPDLLGLNKILTISIFPRIYIPPTILIYSSVSYLPIAPYESVCNLLISYSVKKSYGTKFFCLVREFMNMISGRGIFLMSVLSLIAWMTPLVRTFNFINLFAAVSESMPGSAKSKL